MQIVKPFETITIKKKTECNERCFIIKKQNKQSQYRGAYKNIAD